jgi:hypothetical protein
MIRCCVDWQVVDDVAEEPVASNFQEVEEE